MMHANIELLLYVYNIYNTDDSNKHWHWSRDGIYCLFL